MTKPGESKMVERPSPQVRINTRAVEIVAELKGELNGHKDMDGLQFANIRAELAEIKSDIKDLSTDAKDQVAALAEKQEGYHRTNSGDLAEVKSSLAALISERAGANGVGGLLIKIAPIVLSCVTLGFWIWGGRH